jgi:hypothetical protein
VRCVYHQKSLFAQRSACICTRLVCTDRARKDGSAGPSKGRKGHKGSDRQVLGRAENEEHASSSVGHVIQ